MLQVLKYLCWFLWKKEIIRITEYNNFTWRCNQTNQLACVWKTNPGLVQVCVCTRFRYPTDGQLLICLLFQRHNSGLYSFNLVFVRVNKAGSNKGAVYMADPGRGCQPGLGRQPGSTLLLSNACNCLHVTRVNPSCWVTRLETRVDPLRRVKKVWESTQKIM